MTERFNPPDQYDSTGFGFSHAAISTGGRTIHCAGQVACDKDRAVVGPGDLAAQARQCMANLKAVLAAAAATPAPNTWIGVQSIAPPDFLIEVEATAVVE